ncbi:MAG: hypothetical protein AAF587_44995, partial [Bacteroidota bacterium]
DPVTNLVEINPLVTKTSEEVSSVVEDNWISRYPRPMKCITDQGSEFGVEFADMLKRNGITHSTSSSRNPQGNAMIERIHQSMGNVLRIAVMAENPKTIHEATQVIRKTCAITMHACRCASNGTLGNTSSGALAFGRDMLMDIPLIADLISLQRNRQALIDKNLLQANAKRVAHDFAVGEPVLKKMHLGLSDKLAPAFSGPYPILRVHTNGTVTLRLSPLQTERINIRRIKPYHPRT